MGGEDILKIMPAGKGLLCGIYQCIDEIGIEVEVGARSRWGGGLVGKTGYDRSDKRVKRWRTYLTGLCFALM